MYLIFREAPKITDDNADKKKAVPTATAAAPKVSEKLALEEKVKR